MKKSNKQVMYGAAFLFLLYYLYKMNQGKKRTAV